MIRTSFDAEADAFYAWFAPEGTKVALTEEVAPGVMLDRNEVGDVVGIEVLGVAARLAGDEAKRMRAAAE